MIRINIYLTEKQVEELRKMSKETGLTFADLVRRLLDKALEDKKK